MHIVTSRSPLPKVALNYADPLQTLTLLVDTAIGALPRPWYISPGTAHHVRDAETVAVQSPTPNQSTAGNAKEKVGQDVDRQTRSQAPGCTTTAVLACPGHSVVPDNMFNFPMASDAN